jgi:hypothetical protein
VNFRELEIEIALMDPEDLDLDKLDGEGGLTASAVLDGFDPLASPGQPGCGRRRETGENRAV